MPLNPDLVQMLESARSLAERADPLSLSSCSKNATTMVRSVRQYVVPTAELDAMFDVAHDACEALARANAWDRDELKEAAGRVTSALEALRPVLDRAEPNDRAKALGLDWWPDR